MGIVVLEPFAVIPEPVFLPDSGRSGEPNGEPIARFEIPPTKGGRARPRRCLFRTALPEAPRKKTEPTPKSIHHLVDNFDSAFARLERTVCAVKLPDQNHETGSGLLRSGCGSSD
jgi:hypothetical protein